MLILVAVTINMSINGGLFEKVGQAAGDMQNAINAEQQLADGRIKVGDYVNYTPDTGTYKVADGAYGSGIDTTGTTTYWNIEF